MPKSSGKSKPKIRILLADAHHMVRRGIRQLLESESDLQVVAEAGDGEEAQALIEKNKPDVAVLDIQMPRASGLEVTRWVCAHLPQVGVLILTAYDDDLVQAVRDVHEGKSTLFGPSGHFGVLEMRERAELMGARLEVQSEMVRGTRLSVRLPMPSGKSQRNQV